MLKKLYGIEESPSQGNKADVTSSVRDAAVTAGTSSVTSDAPSNVKVYGAAPAPQGYRAPGKTEGLHFVREDEDSYTSSG